MGRFVIGTVLLFFFLGCVTKGGDTSIEPAVVSSTVVTAMYDEAGFVDDMTIPDGMVIEPGKKFDKTWRLQNSGTTTWKNYKLAFVRGDRLNAPDSVPVETTPPDGEVDITVPMKAPEKPGTYTGHWRLMDDKGVSFGVLIWVMIEVK